MYIIAGCYNVHIGSPFSVYGENMFLLLQSAIIVTLLWIFENNTSKQEKIILSSIILIFFIYLYWDSFVPELLWKILMNCQFLMLTYARMPQILSNYRNKSTGELSFLTFSLSLFGNLARLFTVLKEVTDILYLITCALGTIFNLLIALQIIIYWKNRMPKEAKNKEKLADNVEFSQIEKTRSISADDDSDSLDIKV